MNKNGFYNYLVDEKNNATNTLIVHYSNKRVVSTHLFCCYWQLGLILIRCTTIFQFALKNYLHPIGVRLGEN